MGGPASIGSGAGIGTDWVRARAEFRRMLVWIALVGVAMVAGALIYLSTLGPLTANLVVATTLGVFLSVLLGAGLFAAAFFSSKSGYDDSVTNATRHAGTPVTLPPGLESYRRTDSFTEATVPAGLLADHTTKAGTWGLIHVEEGLLRYRVTDPGREPLDVVLSPDRAPGVIEPAVRHHVEPLGPVRFHVEFWREAGI
ncbi:MAG TPA: DUF1971 domain-containing protein [Sphingomonas sp.]|nr:DUF1971 domain-containing protein [Sphingomonas sp.]